MDYSNSNSVLYDTGLVSGGHTGKAYIPGMIRTGAPGPWKSRLQEERARREREIARSQRPIPAIMRDR
jgi:hypothetical protein